MASESRILSIQSHVVHGYAGNKCAVFPLQALGFEVDFVNSVQYSNHTGYPHVRGTKFTASELHDVYEGLKLNKIAQYSHVLTGYVANVEFLRELAKIISDVKSQNPEAIYLCDPVLGDHGGYYVPPELTAEYRKHLLPLCDILAPNQFELEKLTEMDVSTEANILKAMQKLHDMGVPNVVLSSSNLNDENFIYCFGSSKKGEVQFRINIPKLPAQLVGTGDLFAAMTLAWNSKSGCFRTAVQNAVNTVYQIIKDTLSWCEISKLRNSDLPDAAIKELRIIQNLTSIIDPSDVIKASEI